MFGTPTTLIRDPERCRLYLDRVLRRLIGTIQLQGSHWEGDPKHEPNAERREGVIFDATVQIAGELAMAARAMRLGGYPVDAAGIDQMLAIVNNEDLQEHTVREALSLLHEAYCKPSVKPEYVAD